MSRETGTLLPRLQTMHEHFRCTNCCAVLLVRIVTGHFNSCSYIALILASSHRTFEGIHCSKDYNDQYNYYGSLLLRVVCGGKLFPPTKIPWPARLPYSGKFSPGVKIRHQKQTQPLPQCSAPRRGYKGEKRALSETK